MDKKNVIKKIKINIQDRRFWIKLSKNMYSGFKEAIRDFLPCCLK